MSTPRTSGNRAASNAKIKCTKEEYVEALEKLVINHDSKKPKIKALQEEIKKYSKKQLDHDDPDRKEVAPGVFTTGFKHVLFLEGADAVHPDDTKLDFEDGMIRSLAGLALKQAKGEAIPKCNIYTMDDVINGKPPSFGKDYPAYEAPLQGMDGHGNSVVLLQQKHPDVGTLIKKLTESREELSVGNDAYAAMRAAWLASLIQLNKDQVITALKDTEVDQDQAKRIAEMADILNNANDLKRFLLNDDGSPCELEYPVGANGKKMFDPHEFAADLEVATKNLFKGKSDVLGGLLLDDPAAPEFTGSHVFSLMNMLGTKAVIHGNGKAKGMGADADKPVDMLSVSFEGVDEQAATFLSEKNESHAELMHELCDALPVLVRMPNGQYALRVSTDTKMTTPDNDAEGQNDADNHQHPANEGPGPNPTSTHRPAGAPAQPSVPDPTDQTQPQPAHQPEPEPIPVPSATDEYFVRKAEEIQREAGKFTEKTTS